MAKRPTVDVDEDNVLTHHLELYKDEINEIYDRKTQKPL